MSTLKKDTKIAERSNIDLLEAEKARLIRKYEKLPKSAGRTQALRQLKGEKLTYQQATEAECFTCTNGIKDCIRVC